MSDYIYVKIKRPEGYEDVAEDLVLDDFRETAATANWNVEIVDLKARLLLAFAKSLGVEDACGWSTGRSILKHLEEEDGKASTNNPG